MKNFTFLLLLLIGMIADSYSQATLCEDAVPVTLPFSTNDDASEYGNSYNGVPGQSGCGTFNNYLNDNDVVYAYTANFTGSINVRISTNSFYVGLFAYANCADIGVNCLNGVVMEDTNSSGYISFEAFPVILGQTYYFLVSSWDAPEPAVFHLDITENTCTSPQATYTVVSDCTITDQFFVDVNITDLGGTFSLTVADDLGSNAQTVSDLGIVTFGPYANGTSAQFTVRNSDNVNCFITSAAQTQIICQPINNFCSNAIDLGLQTSPIDGTTIGATNKNITSCIANRAAGEVYYKILVPNTNTLTISQIDSNYDSVISLFYGSCDNLIELTCFDDPETYIYTNNTGSDQTFYWVQDGFNAQTGNFILEWSMTSCVVPEALYTVVPDCANGEQFLVTANLYTLGSANSVTITDNQGSAAQTLTATGELQFGPYPNSTPVLFTATNDDDVTCSLDSQIVTQEECPPTCTNATLNYNILYDCPNTDTFYVDLNVSDLGSATSVSLSDDQQSPVQNITAPGIYTFGPYPKYSIVIFTVANDQDNDCIFTVQVQSVTTCAPINDNCSNPSELTVNFGFLNSTSEGATLSLEVPYPTCGNMFFSNAGKDVWFTTTVPASGNITIETQSAAESDFNLFDSAVQLYSGDCTNLIALGCDNDSGNELFSLISLSERTPGEVIYLRVFGTFGSQGAFNIAAYDNSLATTSFENTSISAYPNPVQDYLNLSYSNTINSVSIFNMLGQEVFAKQINDSRSKIDLSGLAKGTYLVKILSGDVVKTIKISKE